MPNPSLEKYLDSADKIVVLTGAGISTDSGIPDFRSTSGIWTEDHQLEYYMSVPYFKRNPEQFWKYYKDVFKLKLFGNFSPNSGHQFLANLEKQGKEVKIYTQNIDGLHQKAGNSEVFEVHGSLLEATCPTCHSKYDLAFIQQHETPICPVDGSVLKPGMVLFGDPIHYLNDAVNDLQTADLFLVLGTSLQVSPINELPKLARYFQVPSVLINLDQTPLDSYFSLVFHEKISSVV